VRPSQPAPRIVTTRFAPHAGAMTSFYHNFEFRKDKYFCAARLTRRAKQAAGFSNLLVPPRQFLEDIEIVVSAFILIVILTREKTPKRVRFVSRIVGADCYCPPCAVTASHQGQTPLMRA
jgi:hypothetical protein